MLSLLAVVGMTLRQLPGFAFRSATDYSNEMDRIHGIYDQVLGTDLVNALERIQVWHIFSSTWFSIGLVVLIISDPRDSHVGAPGLQPRLQIYAVG